MVDHCLPHRLQVEDSAGIVVAAAAAVEGIVLVVAENDTVNLNQETAAAAASI